MYLHIGENFVLKTQSIIAVFDMDTATVNKATRDYLKKAQKENRIVYTGFDLPKSFIVTNEKIYVSSLNTSTLLKRTRQEI